MLGPAHLDRQSSALAEDSPAALCDVHKLSLTQSQADLELQTHFPSHLPELRTRQRFAIYRAGCQVAEDTTSHCHPAECSH